MKIKNFTDLTVWQEAHRLVLLVFKITDSFSYKDRFLLDQVRRASVSITSNIAEGFSRQGRNEKIQFYFMAKGSLTEAQNLLIVLRDTRIIDLKKFHLLNEKTITVHKLINGFIKVTKQNSSFDIRLDSSKSPNSKVKARGTRFKSPDSKF